MEIMNPSEAKTILIVDDEPSLPEAISFFLESEGYRTRMANSGNQAYGIVERERIDLVLSDIRMNDGDGIELLQKLRHRHFDLPPVVLITGYADLTLPQALDLGAQDLVRKPFDLNRLITTVQHCLLSRSQRWSASPNSSLPVEHLPLAAGRLEEAVARRALSIGLGGFFLPHATLHGGLNAVLNLRTGTTFGFSFDFTGPEASAPIRGQGKVAWSRMGSGNELPDGWGIEIRSLEPRARELIETWIQANRPRSFIPRQ